MKSLNVSSDQFNEMNREASTKLCDIIVTSYIEKWVARDAKYGDPSVSQIPDNCILGLIYEIEQKF